MIESRRKLWMTSAIAERSARQILKAAVVYFAIVFGIGFAFGTIRVLWIVPVLGFTNAELLEQPLMLMAVWLTAKWIVMKFGQRLSRPELFIVGVIALGILLLGEVLVVLVAQPVRASDTIAGVAYLLNLVAFAVMPWLISWAMSIRDAARSAIGPRPARERAADDHGG